MSFYDPTVTRRQRGTEDAVSSSSSRSGEASMLIAPRSGRRPEYVWEGEDSDDDRTDEYDDQQDAALSAACIPGVLLGLDQVLLRLGHVRLRVAHVPLDDVQRLALQVHQVGHLAEQVLQLPYALLDGQNALVPLLDLHDGIHGPIVQARHRLVDLAALDHLLDLVIGDVLHDDPGLARDTLLERVAERVGGVLELGDGLAEVPGLRVEQVAADEGDGGSGRQASVVGGDAVEFRSDQAGVPFRRDHDAVQFVHQASLAGLLDLLHRSAPQQADQVDRLGDLVDAADDDRERRQGLVHLRRRRRRHVAHFDLDLARMAGNHPQVAQAIHDADALHRGSRQRPREAASRQGRVPLRLAASWAWPEIATDGPSPVARFRQPEQCHCVY